VAAAPGSRKQQFRGGVTVDFTDSTSGAWRFPAQPAGLSGNRKIIMTAAALTQGGSNPKPGSFEV